MGHPGRDRDAVHHDRAGRPAARPVRLDHLRLRRHPPPHRHPDADPEGRDRIEPEKNPVVRLARRFLPFTQILRWRSLLHPHRQRAPARDAAAAGAAGRRVVATWSSPSTASRPSSRSPATRSWSTARTSSPSWAPGALLRPGRHDGQVRLPEAGRGADPDLRRRQDDAELLGPHPDPAVARRHPR